MRRFFKQFIFGLLYLSMFAAVAGVVYYFYFIPEPSCFDNIENRNETGVDCGGPCPDCELKTLTLKIDEPQAFEAGQFKSTILAKITNPSVNYGLNDFEYEFQVFSLFGTIISRYYGRSAILTNESKYIVVFGIDIDLRDIGKIIISVPNQNWLPETNLPNYNLKLKNIETRRVQNSVQVSGSLLNDFSRSFSSVNLTGILFAEDGHIINASATKIDNISAFSDTPFIIFYPPINKLPEINFGATKVFYEIKR